MSDSRCLLQFRAGLRIWTRSLPSEDQFDRGHAHGRLVAEKARLTTRTVAPKSTSGEGRGRRQQVTRRSHRKAVTSLLGHRQTRRVSALRPMSQPRAHQRTGKLRDHRLRRASGHQDKPRRRIRTAQMRSLGDHLVPPKTVFVLQATGGPRRQCTKRQSDHLPRLSTSLLLLLLRLAFSATALKAGSTAHPIPSSSHHLRHSRSQSSNGARRNMSMISQMLLPRLMMVIDAAATGGDRSPASTRLTLSMPRAGDQADDRLAHLLMRPSSPAHQHPPCNAEVPVERTPPRSRDDRHVIRLI